MGVMANYHAVVTLDPASGFDADAAVNTFSFTSVDELDAAGRLDVLNAINQFYNGIAPGQVSSVASYLSAILDRSVGGASIRLYDITGAEQAVNVADPGDPPKWRTPPHGSPIEDSAFTLAAAAGQGSLPQQVAMALTLRARGALEDPVEGAGGIRPRARSTGKLYLGPLGTVAANVVNGVVSRPTTAFREDAMRAAEGLQDALVDGSYAWGVWSRMRGEVIPVTRVEVDDSFDTQRRRQSPPSVRNSVTFAPEPGLILGA
jgi:hypothetical protein